MTTYIWVVYARKRERGADDAAHGSLNLLRLPDTKSARIYIGKMPFPFDSGINAEVIGNGEDCAG